MLILKSVVILFSFSLGDFVIQGLVEAFRDQLLADGGFILGHAIRHVIFAAAEDFAGTGFKWDLVLFVVAGIAHRIIGFVWRRAIACGRGNCDFANGIFSAGAVGFGW